MRFFYYGKDGGPESTVWGFWLCEIKSLFSIVLLRFENGSRDSYHNHAFNSVSWVLKGKLIEFHHEQDPWLVSAKLSSFKPTHYEPSFAPIITRRSTFHRVVSIGRTWVLSFRGPWTKTWDEYDPDTHKYTKLANGREHLFYSRCATIN